MTKLGLFSKKNTKVAANLLTCNPCFNIYSTTFLSVICKLKDGSLKLPSVFRLCIFF